jgi:hypothetical protein
LNPRIKQTILTPGLFFNSLRGGGLPFTIHNFFRIFEIIKYSQGEALLRKPDPKKNTSQIKKGNQNPGNVLSFLAMMHG